MERTIGKKTFTTSVGKSGSHALVEDFVQPPTSATLRRNSLTGGKDLSEGNSYFLLVRLKPLSSLL